MLNICMVGHGMMGVWHSEALRGVDDARLHTVVGRPAKPVGESPATPTVGNKPPTTLITAAPAAAGLAAVQPMHLGLHIHDPAHRLRRPHVTLHSSSPVCPQHRLRPLNEHRHRVIGERLAARPTIG
jgi:hypothetical protein